MFNSLSNYSLLKFCILFFGLTVTLISVLFLNRADAQTIPPGLLMVPPLRIFWGGVPGDVARSLADAVTFGQDGRVCLPGMTSEICKSYSPFYDPDEFPPRTVLLSKTGVILPPNTWENLVRDASELLKQQERARLQGQGEPQGELRREPIVLLLKLVEKKRAYKAMPTRLEPISEEETPKTLTDDKKLSAQVFLGQFTSPPVPATAPIEPTCSDIPVLYP